MPVEVHHGLLQTEQVINSADDDVNCCRVAGLSSPVVLELCRDNIVSLSKVFVNILLKFIFALELLR